MHFLKTVLLSKLLSLADIVSGTTETFNIFFFLSVFKEKKTILVKTFKSNYGLYFFFGATD